MRIQFRRCDNQGNPHDSRSGAPMSPTIDDVYSILVGKTIFGVGGIRESTESVQIAFSDRSSLWFITEGGSPRIVFVDAPSQ